MVGARNRLSYGWKKLLFGMGAVAIAYTAACLLLFFGQRYLLYRPKSDLAMLPSADAFKLPYEDVWISIAHTRDRLHGWWVPSPATGERYAVLPQEPAKVLTTARTILYFSGVGRNIGDYNYLARVAAFHQLGFSVLVVDYRGYGRSGGSFPDEQQVYEDSQAAWQYLRENRHLLPEQILLYGESLGGAIALDLAIRHPEAKGLIMQSSFTSMAEVAEQRSFLQFFPVRWLLTEHFDSLSKVRSLHMPVLFLHGTADSVVPPEMSQRLYDAASEPKQLFFIAGAEHVRLYQPGAQSYLKAIQQFIGPLQRRTNGSL
ncbi:MAG: alpha/beta hydrolase [Leptolyngbya sp. BL-A-14]